MGRRPVGQTPLDLLKPFVKRPGWGAVRPRLNTSFLGALARCNCDVSLKMSQTP